MEWPEAQRQGTTIPWVSTVSQAQEGFWNQSMCWLIRPLPDGHNNYLYVIEEEADAQMGYLS